MNLEKLKQAIIDDAAKGVDFGCACYYCGATPIDLVNRGDSIPIIYGSPEKYWCFRCSDEAGYNIKSEFIKDPQKQKEAFKDFSYKLK
jgi:hypothetical protein